MTFEDYKNEFLKADSELSKFRTFKKYFRFPYLREGDSIEKRDGMRETLKKMGYQNAYITSNNYDWYIDELFQKTVEKDPEFDMNKMRDFYVNILLQSISFYDQMAVIHLGRSPKHILLLHEMDITALFIDDLIEALQADGWKIISLHSALTDEISRYQTTSILKYNPGRIGEIAKDNGQTNGLWHKSCDESYLKSKFKAEVSNLID